ncbi:MAG: hypothetical protein KME30_12510 [Iphinoe sp. HA4291-MV1]|nr:hypothetical protein [Iphinoe sp. HA4291-MV1]
MTGVICIGEHHKHDERHHCQCSHCGTVTAADWSDEIIPGQDLGVRLQALIGWLGNYAHVPYAKIHELLFELGQIDVGEGTLVATNERVAQASCCTSRSIAKLSLITAHCK